MRVVTASEMREIDRRAIEDYGVPSLDLMERAGAGAAQVIAAAGFDSGSRIVVLCGKGNNGGDGFVVARHLQEWGGNVTAWVLGERDELTRDALSTLVAAEDAGVSIRAFHAGERDGDVAKDLSVAKVGVDAILGTGANGNLRDPVRRLTRLLNETEASVFSLDMPTGMNADSGEVDPDCVHSMMTITFGFPKRGLYSLPGRDLCGDITVVDLGYPEETLDVTTGVLLWQEMAAMMPFRDPAGHKGTFGQVAMLAGSRGMAGAACLASDAAMRSGAGMVKLLVPESIADICAVKLTETMVFGLPETADGKFCAASAEAASSFLGEADAVLIGPGMSLNDDTREFVRAVLPRIGGPMILDADGLNAVASAKDEAVAHRLGELPTLLTPHPGELARLLGRDAAKLQGDRVGSAREAAEKYGCEVVFKGAPTVIASPDGTSDLCSLGNDGLATAGSGDVLAGLLAGLLAQGYPVSDAGRVGAMVHGRAGDICRMELGRRGMVAGDLARCLPYAWRELEFGSEALASEEEPTPDPAPEEDDGE